VDLARAQVTRAEAGAAALEDLGTAAAEWTPLPHAAASQDRDGSVVGEMVHIDRFGNLVTNIDASQLPPDPVMTVASTVIDRVCGSYGEVEPGGVLAIVGTTGKLEISINRGSAAKKLLVSKTDPVSVGSASVRQTAK
jgi:S-adenosylmethionine hydrolase